MENLDWRWLKSFLAVAHAQGMHAAAQHSQISQTTLSRHIALLEEALGYPLFDRQPRGLKLSQRGAQLFEYAIGIESSVKAFERQALGINEEEAGSVRVTMSQQFGAYFAPMWLKQMRKTSPHIQIDLLLREDSVNLLMRGAEIAVRHYKPEQLDIVMRYCGQMTNKFFASQDYLETHPEFTTLEDLYKHDLVGYDRVTSWIQAASHMGYTFTREDFACRTDQFFIHPELVRQGLGIGVLPKWIGQKLGLVCLLESIDIPGQPIYLAAHQDLHQNPRVLHVWRSLEHALTQKFREV